jgi:two-component system, NarL family, sensor histidine kinase DegS
MQLHASERRSLKRQVTLVRPLMLVLGIASLLEMGSPPRWVLGGMCVYLSLSLLVAWAQVTKWGADWKFPLVIDILALPALLIFSPTIVPMWFLLLFVAFASAVDWGWTAGLLIVSGAAAVTLGWWLAIHHEYSTDVLRAVSIAAATLASGLGMAYLGERNRRSAAEYNFLARLNSALRVERGVAESLKGVFQELLDAFDCDLVVLVNQDQELERVVVYRMQRGQKERIAPEILPLTAADGFLLEMPDVSFGWNGSEEKRDLFGWNRNDGSFLEELPNFPKPTRDAMQIKSAIATIMEIEGEPSTRLILANSRRGFLPRDLRWLERIVRHISMSVENLFLLRHLRARAIEAERSRISRDLHDGILQTLLSVQIQLDVLRRKLPDQPDQASTGLSGLEQTVRNESAELRRMVSDLRPLRVQSADLVDLMTGFAERFRNESELQLDLLVDAATLQAPDEVCRELFQIYREALNNIKKHARASHVVVKLTQSDSLVSLVVDDNGEGFSFAGKFSADELDRLRIGPISIKEHARTIGGVLTVESSPGHGARLTVEVPLS